MHYFLVFTLDLKLQLKNIQRLKTINQIINYVNTETIQDPNLKAEVRSYPILNCPNLHFASTKLRQLKTLNLTEKT